MRFSILSLILLLASSALTAQVRVTVVDPQGAVVSGARVALVDPTSSRPVATRTTAGDGLATFDVDAGTFTIEVLAPGFAPVRETAPVGGQPLVVKLKPASLPQTVTVSATATPVAEQQAGVPNVALDRAALVDMQSTSAGEALRFLPGALVHNAGQRGGQASLFVRGGESRYNRVLVDGVPINDPGGFFDFGVVPLFQVDRVEMVRGPASSLYGSDAMTSVVQFFSAAGHSPRPELMLGADGGNFSTAHGYGALSGARSRFDYNLFAEQFDTEGKGPNDHYANTDEGGNVGIAITRATSLRLRMRHSVNASGVQGEWNFNGAKLLAPDADQFARQNNLTGSAELAWSGAQWQHRITAFEYSHDRRNIESVADRGCDFVKFVFIDCPFATETKFNRAGFDYQGEFTPRTWSHTTFGYTYQDEHGDTRDPIAGDPQTHGLRHQHELFAQEFIVRGRLAASFGLRYIRNDSFGHTTVPRLTAAWTLLKGGTVLSGTRLRFAAGEGIMAPDFIETFGSAAFFILPNPALHAERNRSVETGILQGFAANRLHLGATYYNNLFHNRIQFESLGPPDFKSHFVNLDRVLSHGAEVDLNGRIAGNFGLQSGYVYTSTQILRAPLSPSSVGQALLRRPKHSGNFLLTYNTRRWGGDVGGTFVGRRPDSDFLGLGVNHAAGYARVDAGAWYAFTRRATAYINLENAFDKNYNEVVGYPGLGRNFRVGVRYRLGGE
jgi:outer membrane cobalamin receptor